MAESLLPKAPSRIERSDVTVMGTATPDDIEHIKVAWAPFEEIVGLRGRKMYALIDTTAKTYTVCTPVKEEDDPAALGLGTMTFPGGPYLRGRLIGDPPELYTRIGPAMMEIEAIVSASGSIDPRRPLVEYYKRLDEVELWVPIGS